jgi:SAM-dependent methyltransferase
MMRTSEKRHWDDYWADSQNLDDLYGTDERILENLKGHVEYRGLRVLEIGAGTGRDTDRMAADGADAYALDYSEESLLLMHRNFQSDVGIVCGDALSLPFIDGSFDLVFHQGLLEHFRDPGALVDENIRILKDGGILLIDVPQRFHYYTLLKHVLIALGRWFAGWETEFSVGELRRILEERGLEIVHVYGHNLFPPIWYRGLRRILLKAGLRLPMQPENRFLRGLRESLRSLIPKTLYINTSMVIGCVAVKNRREE